MIKAVIGILGSIMISVLVAQTALTNDSIVKMVKAGLGEDIIVSTIKSQPGQYGITADDLITLKTGGVSDKIIAAMMEKNSGAPSAAPAPSGNPLAAAVTPAAAATPAPVVNEIGVYYSKAGKWTDLSPELVNFKTGGVLKTIGTAGVLKGDVNGHLNGLHSPNQLKTPVELLVYTPEGTNITEYQLLRLRDQKDSREFRTVTGGVFHASGGATRDAMPFEGKKVAARTYTVSLPGIAPGDYGLLPPPTGDGTGSSGRIGKLYTFRVIE